MGDVMLQEAISVAASLMLLISFALLAQHRLLSVLHWFAAQGVVLALTTLLVAVISGHNELYFSALMTLLLKGALLPWLLWRIIRKMHVHREVEPLVNMPVTMFIALTLVLVCFYVALPIERMSQLVTHNTLAIAMATVFLSMLMMITRKKAITQVIGFLSIENALFFTAIGATHGMPMIVELGVAFDVLIAAIIFGLFFTHMRSTFDSLDLDVIQEKSKR
ncbi:MAG: formate hydrogenlyase [Mariprofundus sp.]|nr:formate hydrogenlyase [Mariprofundus sp.]